jgi:hypothetical protein
MRSHRPIWILAAVTSFSVACGDTIVGVQDNGVDGSAAGSGGGAGAGGAGVGGTATGGSGGGSAGEMGQAGSVASGGGGAAGGNLSDGGGTPVDSGLSDASLSTPACDLLKPFGKPSLVPGAVNSSSNDRGFWISPDQLTVYVGSARNGSYDILTGTRPNTGVPFTTLATETGLSSNTIHEESAILTGDLLTVFFMRQDAAGDRHIYSAMRGSALVLFTNPAPVAPPLSAGAGFTDWASWVSPDGSRLYFQSNRAGGVGYDFFVAERTGNGPFGTPQPIPSLNSPADDELLVLTSDELHAILYSNRNGSPALFHADRSSVSAGFSVPALLSEISSPTALPLWVSGDGCTLYFRDTVADGGLGGEDIWQATRPK